MDKLLRGIFALLIGFTLMMGFLATRAHAHMKDRPDLNDWFGSLQNKHKGLCCSTSDGVALADIEWETKNGHYRVYLGKEWDSQWHDVPDDAVVEEPNKYGPALVWPVRSMTGVQIRCFMPGTMS